ncbi:MAG: hypothetical protein M1602_00270 [Firmicutes bacterium]|nr:hypothetical protein [Bacillota bacterium]
MNRAAKTSAVALLVLGVVSLAGCSSKSAPAPTAQPVATAPAPAPAPPKKVSLYLTILTGEQIGKKEGPTFVPGSFNVPADTDVEVTIRNYDDGPADIPVGDEKVQGTIGGTMTVISELTGDVDKAAGKSLTELDPKAVAHTLTINENGFNLNVPIPPSSTVKFTFHSPKAGTYSLRCLSACGIGPSGTEGSMAMDGWMRGTMTVN